PSTRPNIYRRRSRYASITEAKHNLPFDPFHGSSPHELFHLGGKMGRLALWSKGLATDSVAINGGCCNNSANCFARTQIYGFNAHRTDCCQLSCIQFEPYLLGCADSLLFAFGGVESFGRH